MFITTRTHAAALAAKEAEIAALRKEVAQTGVLLTTEKVGHAAAVSTIADQQDEIERLAKDVKSLAGDAEKHRLSRSKLIPGGPYRGKGSRRAQSTNTAAPVAVAG